MAKRWRAVEAGHTGKTRITRGTPGEGNGVGTRNVMPEIASHSRNRSEFTDRQLQVLNGAEHE